MMYGVHLSICSHILKRARLSGFQMSESESRSRAAVVTKGDVYNYPRAARGEDKSDIRLQKKIKKMNKSHCSALRRLPSDKSCPWLHCKRISDLSSPRARGWLYTSQVSCSASGTSANPGTLITPL
jgi:hypothetical protein